MKKMRNQIAACIVCEMLFTATTCFMGTTYILFLRKIGLSYFQIGAINIGCVVAMNLLNTPAGAFADKYGRRTSFIIGCAINAIAIAVYYFASNFITTLIVEMMAGIGFAFYADSLNALIVCRVKDSGGNINRVLSKVSMLDNLMMLVGGSLGALIAKNNLGVPFLLGGLASASAGIFAWMMVEESEVTKECERRNLIKASYHGIKEVFANRTLLILVAMTFVLNINGQIFVKMFTPLLRPMVSSQADMSWIWALLMTGSIIGGFTSYCARARKLKLLLVTFQVLQGIPLILCAAFPMLGFRVGALMAFETIHTAIKPIMNTKKNDCIANHNRATVLSAFSTLASLGSILGLCAGLLADRTSISFTWISIGSTTTILSIILAALFTRSKTPT